MSGAPKTRIRGWLGDEPQGPRIAIERAERTEVLDESSSERFDRLAFAERAIALVRPPNMTVVVGESARGVQVASGRQWGAPLDARWAIVRVPPDASRRAIAAAVLALHGGAGHDGGAGPYRAARAWALDVLMVELGGARPAERSRFWGDAE